MTDQRLAAVTNSIWEAREDIRMPGGIWFNSRMTIADVGNGELLLHSPVSIDETLRQEISQHGDVRWIVAPNDLHNTWVGSAADAFPNAEVWGSPGAVKKQRTVEFDGVLDGAQPASFEGKLDTLFIPGTRMWAESVFLLPDRTLLCSDLVFNIHEARNLWTKLFLKLDLAYGKCAQGISIRWVFTKDRRQVGHAFAQILEWDFDRVVMGHGNVVHHGGKEILERELAWAVQRVPRALASEA